MANWIGLDIGGANLKAADSLGNVAQIAFPLWKKPERLESALRDLLSNNSLNCSASTRIAATMTGELADCFATKQDGVEFICEQAVRLTNHEVLFYQTNGSFVSQTEAAQSWLETAASNWHAIARWLGRHLPQQNGFLIDIGSTSTDIIPVRDGFPDCRTETSAPLVTDRTRLANHELVYLGTERTPVCALVQSVTLNGRPTQTANEWFATVKDAMIVLGERSPEPANLDSADGRPLTISNSFQRLARMVCDDADQLGPAQVQQIAHQVHLRLIKRISGAIDSVQNANPDLPPHFVLAGSGSWLAKQALEQRTHTTEYSLISVPYTADQLTSAAALAVCALAQERETQANEA